MIAALPLVSSALSSVFGPSQATSQAATNSISASSSAANGDSFASMIASFSNDTVEKMKSSEAMSVQGIQGKATTQAVVEAVMQGQEALQTALAVRDKTVTAFQDITRMSI